MKSTLYQFLNKYKHVLSNNYISFFLNEKNRIRLKLENIII